MRNRWMGPIGLTTLIVLVLTCGTFVWAQESQPLFPRGTIRVLILSGRNNHDWRMTTPYLRELLLETGLFDVRVAEEPAGATAATLQSYDLLVLNYNGPRWGEVTEKAVAAFLQSGKGLVAVHGASYAFSGLEILGERGVHTGTIEPAWPEYAKMIGGVWTEEAPKTGHGKRHSFRVRLTNAAHPIAQGMEGTFIATDELYHNMRMQSNVKVLATAYSDPGQGGTAKDEPVLWTLSYGQGRVFHTALGHDLVAMHEPGFIRTFLRGCEWAATGAVTLPLVSERSTRETAAVKVLVVTGGHDYETSFYTVFEGYDDLVWSHKASPDEAFRNDIRQRYDVLVLYDMTKERIGNGARDNLRAFVESGKGVVALHHAIADYPDWSWWYKEVVGGLYLIEPAMGLPASTFKHDEELLIHPVTDHPITAGIAPLHLWDETYKGMWISPDVTVLLETDNATSDGPVVWIGPYEKSRVVYIQPGHDHHAHLHPGYKKLVRRAIMWTAGRLN